MSGPLSTVLAAITDGAITTHEIARRTALSPDTVAASIEHLVRIGRLTASTLARGCPDGGCGGCASGDNGAPGCGAAGPSQSRRGPTLVALTIKRGR